MYSYPKWRFSASMCFHGRKKQISPSTQIQLKTWAACLLRRLVCHLSSDQGNVWVTAHFTHPQPLRNNWHLEHQTPCRDSKIDGFRQHLVRWLGLRVVCVSFRKNKYPPANERMSTLKRDCSESTISPSNHEYSGDNVSCREVIFDLQVPAKLLLVYVDVMLTVCGYGMVCSEAHTCTEALV